MTVNLHNLDAALAYIDSKSVRTDRGSYVRVEDVKEAMQQLREDRVEEALRPKPRTMVEAKRMARQDEELMKSFPPPSPQPPGRSVPAMEPSPSSRT